MFNYEGPWQGMQFRNEASARMFVLHESHKISYPILNDCCIMIAWENEIGPMLDAAKLLNKWGGIRPSDLK